MPHKVTRYRYSGAGQTVALIVYAALKSQHYFSVRQLAELICGRLRSKDYLSEYAAIYNYVQSHTRYMRDPKTVELVRDPYIVADEILQGKTPSLDCDDLCALLAALMLSVGASTRIVTVAFHHAFHKGERQYSHVFVQAQEPKTSVWITLDPVAGVNTATMQTRAVAAKVYPVAV